MSNRRLAYVVLTASMVMTYFGFFPTVFTSLLSSESDVPSVVTNSQSWGELQINRSVSQTPLMIQGRRYWKGFGTHAESTIEVQIPEGATTFQGACGLDDFSQGLGEFTCEIRRSGQVVWQTSLVGHKEPLQSFRIPLSPGDRLELRVHATARGIDYAHANWVNLRFGGESFTK